MRLYHIRELDLRGEQEEQVVKEKSNARVMIIHQRKVINCQHHMSLNRILNSPRMPSMEQSLHLNRHRIFQTHDELKYFEIGYKGLLPKIWLPFRA